LAAARLLNEMPEANDIKLISEAYDPPGFYSAISGMEAETEGGARCAACYALRLKKTAEKAAALAIPYYTTTLSISPHKNAQALNDLGMQYAKQYQINYLPSDFKKRDGYKKSLALSKIYNLYRQDYCGCKFSMKTD
jgi:predicted adenine nucleotide alpha hydrolase (AANH) superfamily ATPase